MATYKVAVLPGDGIGQEVTPEAVRILKAVGKGASTDVIEASARAYLSAINRLVQQNGQRMKEIGP